MDSNDYLPKWVYKVKLLYYDAGQLSSQPTKNVCHSSRVIQGTSLRLLWFSTWCHIQGNESGAKQRFRVKATKKWKWDWRTNYHIKPRQDIIHREREKKREREQIWPWTQGRTPLHQSEDGSKNKTDQGKLERNYRKILYTVNAAYYRSHQSKCKILIWLFLKRQSYIMGYIPIHFVDWLHKKI